MSIFYSFVMLTVVFLIIFNLSDVSPYDLKDYYYRFDLECYNISNHRNRRLLPRNPNCGKSQVLRPMTGEIGSNFRIVKKEFPWLVDVEVQQKRKARQWCEMCEAPSWGLRKSCSGALINHRYVLSTASCVHFPPPDQKIYWLRVLTRFPTIERVNHNRDCDIEQCDIGVTRVGVEEVVAHAKFDSVRRNDLCLLRLQRYVSYNAMVQPICLPLSCSFQMREVECYELLVAAWGEDYQGERDESIALRIEVEVTTEPSCDNHVGIPQVTSSQICAFGMPYKFTCRNDSGGPLMMQEIIRGRVTYYLLGLLSYGRDCGDHERYYTFYKPPSVFTEVRYFIQWILEHIRD